MKTGPLTGKLLKESLRLLPLPVPTSWQCIIATVHSLIAKNSLMAWEIWKSSSIERRLLGIVGSALWAAFLLLAAFSLNLNVPYLPLAIAGALVFYLRNWPRTGDLAAWILVSVGFGLVVLFVN